MYLTYCGVHTDRKKTLVKALSEDIYDTLSEVLATGTQIQQLGIVAAEREVYLRIHKHYALECHHDIVHLRSVRLQELSSCRNVEEQVLNHEITSHGTCHRLLVEYLAT